MTIKIKEITNWNLNVNVKLSRVFIKTLTGEDSASRSKYALNARLSYLFKVSADPVY
jgi:hypothetical protein